MPSGMKSFRSGSHAGTGKELFGVRENRASPPSARTNLTSGIVGGGRPEEVKP